MRGQKMKIGFALMAVACFTVFFANGYNGLWIVCLVVGCLGFLLVSNAYFEQIDREHLDAEMQELEAEEDDK